MNKVESSGGPTRHTPFEDGFSMPAEWSSHAGCYISWPCRDPTWQGHSAKAKAAYAGVIKAVGEFEPVSVLVRSEQVREVRRHIGSEVPLVVMGLDDSWLRDNGPIFVRNDDGDVAIVKFGFNAWGGKSHPYDSDDRAPIELAKVLQMRHYIAPMILEGGAISVDGEGTLLTTEQCLLNSNRNPNLGRANIEQILAKYLGVKKTIWLVGGLEDDITDGHVDGVASFSGSRVVIAAHTNDRSDPNFKTLEKNIAQLESETDAKGRSIEVIKIVQPRPREVEGIHITPGYTNHYIANGGVVVPTYGIPEDQVAVEILRSAYPGREVVGVECSYIEIGGGAVHCITQQRPAGSPMPL